MNRRFGVRCGNPQCDCRDVIDMRSELERCCTACGEPLPHMEWTAHMKRATGIVFMLRAFLEADMDFDDLPAAEWMERWQVIERLPSSILGMVLNPGDINLEDPHALDTERRELGMRLAVKLGVRNALPPASEWTCG